MDVVTADLGPNVVTLEVPTQTGTVTVINTPERLAEMIARQLPKTG